MHVMKRRKEEGGKSGVLCGYLLDCLKPRQLLTFLFPTSARFFLVFLAPFTLSSCEHAAEKRIMERR